ncbi:hypothetical protein Lalb_Chr10g0095761 [Lupinus albus]|uniref:Uncharacterized protein n=1 Tax=Lupinus albus TaxID=3870 RepID=A0A6A4PUZ1_LUPAL|nr:hypothetical protein Lalb_Chr10g0095761 [Lupinus albus]
MFYYMNHSFYYCFSLLMLIYYIYIYVYLTLLICSLINEQSVESLYRYTNTPASLMSDTILVTLI